MFQDEVDAARLIGRNARVEQVPVAIGEDHQALERHVVVALGAGALCSDKAAVRHLEPPQGQRRLGGARHTIGLEARVVAHHMKMPDQRHGVVFVGTSP